MRSDPSLYVPDSKGAFVEVDHWDRKDGKLCKTNKRYVLPLSYWHNMKPETVIDNLAQAGENPIRVKRKGWMYQLRALLTRR